jgi:lipopolysaccharide export system protein LptC
MSELAERERNARRYWARPSGGHDRFVRLARFVLPVAIGVVAASLIASPLAKSNGDISFLLAKDSVEMAKERLKVTQAVYRGQDQLGRAFVLTAGSAVQATSHEPIVRLHNITARLEMPDGPSTVTAMDAEYDMEAQVIRIIGPVTYRSADGYRLDLANVSIGINTRTVQSNGAAAGQTPRGSVSAGQMQADLRGRTAVLEGGVSGNTPYGQYSAARAQLDLGARRLTLDHGVKGTLKLGSFTAGRLQADLGSRTVILDGGVHMRISQRGLR